MKLVDELERSKSAPLNVLLPAFSIPLIGKTASEKLSKVCEDIEEIDYDLCRKAGLGEKSTASLLNWLEMEFYQQSMGNSVLGQEEFQSLELPTLEVLSHRNRDEPLHIQPPEGPLDARQSVRALYKIKKHCSKKCYEAYRKLE